MQIGVVNPYSNLSTTDVNTQLEQGANEKIIPPITLGDKVSISTEAISLLNQEGEMASVALTDTSGKQQPLTGGGVEPPTVQAYTGGGVEPPTVQAFTGGGVEPPQKTDTGGGVEPPSK